MLTLCVFMSIGAPTLVPLPTEKEWNITNYLDLKEEGDNITGLPKADAISNEMILHHNGTGNAAKEKSLLEDFEDTAENNTDLFFYDDITADIIVNEINFLNNGAADDARKEKSLVEDFEEFKNSNMVDNKIWRLMCEGQHKNSEFHVLIDLMENYVKPALQAEKESYEERLWLSQLKLLATLETIKTQVPKDVYFGILTSAITNFEVQKKNLIFREYI